MKSKHFPTDSHQPSMRPQRLPTGAAEPCKQLIAASCPKFLRWRGLSGEGRGTGPTSEAAQPSPPLPACPPFSACSLRPYHPPPAESRHLASCWAQTLPSLLLCSSLIQQVFPGCLLCARRCSRTWVCNGEPAGRKSLPSFTALTFRWTQTKQHMVQWWQMLSRNVTLVDARRPSPDNLPPAGLRPAGGAFPPPAGNKATCRCPPSQGGGVGDCRRGAGWVRERLPQAARAVSGRLPDFHTRYSGGEGGLSVGVRNRERPDRGGGGIARYVARSHAK